MPDNDNDLKAQLLVVGENYSGCQPPTSSRPRASLACSEAALPVPTYLSQLLDQAITTRLQLQT